MRWFFLIFTILVVAAVFGLRLRGDKFSQPPIEIFNDMDRQYKLKTQKPSEFFADGMGSRRPIEGTVPMGFHLPASKTEGIKSTPLDFSVGDSYMDTGLVGDNYGKGFPEGINVDEAFLARGEERYQIFCTACHGDSGNGKGIVSKYWGVPPTKPSREQSNSDEGYQQKLAAYLAEVESYSGIPPTANLVDPRVAAFPEGQIYHTIKNGKGLMGAYGAMIPVQDRWAITAYVRALQSATKTN